MYGCGRFGPGVRGSSMTRKFFPIFNGMRRENLNIMDTVLSDV